MGIKDRINRIKDNQRVSIINAAITILKTEGRHAITLRRIADNIEYSPPVIYLHYSSKEALLLTIARIGYEQLNKAIEQNASPLSDPQTKLIEVLKTFMYFAIAEKELYLLMTEMGNNCEQPLQSIPEIDRFINLIKGPLEELHITNKFSDELLILKSHIFISLVHGLVSAEMFWQYLEVETTDSMLHRMIGYLLNTLMKA
jgi:AcrR family transcriptional regulator